MSMINLKDQMINLQRSKSILKRIVTKSIDQNINKGLITEDMPFKKQITHDLIQLNRLNHNVVDLSKVTLSKPMPKFYRKAFKAFEQFFMLLSKDNRN